MTRFSTYASAFVLLTAISSPVFAGDIYSKGSTKDGEMQIFQPTEGTVNWSGFYVGGSVGYGNANHDLSVHDYFKDFCADQSAVDSLEGFDPFEYEERHKTLENINKRNAASDKPDWVKAANLRTDCATRVGGTEPGVVRAPKVIDTSAPWNTASVAGDSREIGSLDGVNSTGVVGDVRLGYDRAFGRFLIGAYGSYGFSNMEANGVNTLFGDSFRLEKGDEWSIGARAGYIVAPRTMLYLLAAYTQTDYELSFTRGEDTFSKEATFDGITVGGGVEFALAQNVFFGLEGTHTFYGEETIWDEYDAASNVGTRVDDKLGETKVLGTLKIKLNGFGQ